MPSALTNPVDSPPVASGQAVTEIMVAGRRLRPGPVFDSYWRFAVMRQQLFLSRWSGSRVQATVDPVLRQYRFTNCYRAADRVSQVGIEIAYAGSQEPRDVVLRMLLFKVFNKIETWRLMEERLGPITWRSWRVERARAVLDSAWAAGHTLYSPAYVIPPPRLGGDRKHHDHLDLVDMMIRRGVVEELQAAAGLGQAFEVLRRWPGIGDFLAYQFVIDLNYTSVLNFSENEFVMAGPGAKDGIRKCFGGAAKGIESEVIAYMVDTQQEHFQRLGLRFPYLGGRALHLIDCQNLFCEVDKYARVAHPDVEGISGRTRIKQHYRPRVEPMPTPWFPPKWGINDAVAEQIGLARDEMRDRVTTTAPE